MLISQTFKGNKTGSRNLEFKKLIGGKITVKENHGKQISFQDSGRCEKSRLREIRISL